MLKCCSSKNWLFDAVILSGENEQLIGGNILALNVARKKEFSSNSFFLGKTFYPALDILNYMII